MCSWYKETYRCSSYIINYPNHKYGWYNLKISCNSYTFFSIIQMTAKAGLTVPHSINPVFQYIFDCLGKRSIRSRSKIVAFDTQNIQTSLKSLCTHNKWLFGADFGKVASLRHFSSKMSKEPPLRSMANFTVPFLNGKLQSF